MVVHNDPSKSFDKVSSLDVGLPFLDFLVLSGQTFGHLKSTYCCDQLNYLSLFYHLLTILLHRQMKLGAKNLTCVFYLHAC